MLQLLCVTLFELGQITYHIQALVSSFVRWIDNSTTLQDRFEG